MWPGAHRWSRLKRIRYKNSLIQDLTRSRSEEVRIPTNVFLVLPPGVWSGFGSGLLRSPRGPIHWAGTETPPHFMGTMDGAVSSGQQAAVGVRHGL
jgi:monoamine oxidase